MACANLGSPAPVKEVLGNSCRIRLSSNVGLLILIPVLVLILSCSLPNKLIWAGGASGFAFICAAWRPISSASASRPSSSFTGRPLAWVVGWTRPWRCCTTCVNSCPINSFPDFEVGSNWPGAKWISSPWV